MVLMINLMMMKDFDKTMKRLKNTFTYEPYIIAFIKEKESGIELADNPFTKKFE